MPFPGNPATALIVTALALAASPVAAQGFGDYEHVGKSEDARRQGSGEIGVLGHTFEPSIVYKLFGVTTPHVAAATRLAWTDNYLQEDPDVSGAPLRTGIWETGVKAQLDTEIGDHRIELSYGAVATELIDSGAFDTVNQNALARVDLYAVDTELHADVGWARSNYAQSIQLNGIVRLDTLTASVYGEARIYRFGIRVGGTATGQVYEDLTNLDANAFGVDVQVYGRIRPKLRGLLEYNWSIVTYDEGSNGSLNDYQTHTILGGVDGTITPKLSASLKIGGAIQLVDDDGPNVDDREFGGFVAALSGSYEPFVSTTITASYSRSLSPSTSSNFLLNDDVTFAVSQLLWEETITVGADVGYTRSEVDDDDTINRIRAGASVSYQIRQWLSVVADYTFERVNSSLPQSSYRVHTIGISLGVGL
jgi:hypothetical protein